MGFQQLNPTIFRAVTKQTEKEPFPPYFFLVSTLSVFVINGSVSDDKTEAKNKPPVKKTKRKRKRKKERRKQTESQSISITRDIFSRLIKVRVCHNFGCRLRIGIIISHNVKPPGVTVHRHPPPHPWNQSKLVPG
ncbi:hypothetical protein AVEN_91752-1 [Araneus ventricosus]|uniref:Uncharacterized protein n=1 Tax=Araneus ventricosus TaxID=182803 RepID=A0A4Y2HV52_ARAVE|nr:hypothetical protein AVEN_91752-1 [Araneus ventricosus]